jgi:uncharacterized protein (TIGR00269 family)
MNVEQTVQDTIKKFKLLKPRDKILVACSGGKDSTTALSILHSLYKDVEAITIDASIGDYTAENLRNIRSFCDEQHIRLHVVSFREEFGYSLCYIRSILKSKGIRLNSCMICGVLKRYLLNKKARELGRSVLVTGHNMDDEAQSILMNLLRGNIELLFHLGPGSKTRDTRFIPRIKPLYLVREQDVREYSRKMKFPVAYGRCPCSVESYRNTIRTLLATHEKKHPGTTRRIVDYLLSHLDSLPCPTQRVHRCSSCGEPCRQTHCRACQILGALGTSSGKPTVHSHRAGNRHTLKDARENLK